MKGLKLLFAFALLFSLFSVINLVNADWNTCSYVNSCCGSHCLSLDPNCVGTYQGATCYYDGCCVPGSYGDCCPATSICSPACASCTERCDNGHCVSTGKRLCNGVCDDDCLFCYDSDYGKNYAVSGFTQKQSYFGGDSGFVEVDDSCIGTGVLSEQYCDRDIPSSVSYNCPSGCCSGGACVSGSSATCSSLGKQCGTWPNGCGGTLNCGPSSRTCTKTFGTCNVSGTETCNNGVWSGTCQATNPRTANCAGKNCGSDLCGGTCGNCTTNQTCNSGNCCTPKTCAQLGKNCGTWNDNCGGTVTCNTACLVAGETCSLITGLCSCDILNGMKTCSDGRCIDFSESCGDLNDDCETNEDCIISNSICCEGKCKTECCLSPNKKCSDGSCSQCCDGEQSCGDQCCSIGKVCKDEIKKLCCNQNESVCGNKCCGSGQYCADASSGLCCENGKICANEWKTQSEACTKQDTKNCFDCACHDSILGDLLGLCSGSPIMVGKCTTNQSCCYGNCFNPATQKCCAKDACNNSIIGKTECCTLEPGISAPYIYYLNSTPDFYNDFKNQKEVSYTDVFNKQVKFQVKVNDSDCKDTSFTVFYNITGLSWETPTSISDSVSCQKESLCEITIPSDKIRPGDSPTITLYAQDSDKMNSTKNSTSIQIPNFNIVLDSVSPIQVVEGATLIKGKPTMFRLYYHIYSDIITKADGVDAKASLAGDSISGNSDIKKYPSMTEIINNQDEQSFSDLKNGKDTINLFSVTPSATGIATVYGEINTNKALKESSMLDNNISGTSSVVQTKKLYIIFVPIQTGSWDEGFNQLEFAKTAANGLSFLKDVYPVAPTDVSYKVISPASFSTPSPSIDANAEDDSYLTTVYIQSLLLPELALIKLGTSIPAETDIKVIGIVPNDLMHMSGAAHWFSQDCAIIKTDQSSQSRTSEDVLAHEVAHTYGLGNPEEYDSQNPGYGNLAANGWRVSKGQDGAMINLDLNPEDNIDLVRSSSNPLKFVGYTSNSPTIRCFMGTPVGKVWVDNFHYSDLIDALKK